MEGEGDGVDGMSAVVMTENLVKIAKEILSVAKRIEPLARAASGGKSDVDGETPESSNVQFALQSVYLVKEVLDHFIRFLESPLGHRTQELLWRYANDILAFVEIGAGAIGASCFLVIAQELLDLKEDDFQPARNSIELSIQFVKDTLPKIEARLKDAVDLMPIIHESVEERSNLTWTFEHTIGLAKLDIEECEDHLRRTDLMIEKALGKITARIVLNGIFRGIVLGVGGYVSYYAIRQKLVTLRTGIGIGALTLALCAVGLRVPYYRKLEKDFKNYEGIQKDLHNDLAQLKRRLQHHARSVRTVPTE